MRRAYGYYLIEMIVAVGISGLLITMLSSMLSETLRISSNAQNEIIAATLAEESLECARAMSYSNISQLSNSPLLINATQPGQYQPLQVDTTQSNLIWGAVNPAQGGYIESMKWGANSGNYFKGQASFLQNSGPSFSSSTGVPISSRVPSVTVQYPGMYGSSGTQSGRTLTRSALIFEPVE